MYNTLDVLCDGCTISTNLTFMTTNTKALIVAFMGFIFVVYVVYIIGMIALYIWLGAGVLMAIGGILLPEPRFSKY